MRKLRLGTGAARTQSHRISKQWGQDLSLSLLSAGTHTAWRRCCFRGPPKTPTLPLSRGHTRGPGRQAGELPQPLQPGPGSCGLRAPWRPQRKQAIRGTGGLGPAASRLLGGRKAAARAPPGFPPEPQGPPCLSTGVLAASSSPLPFSGFLPQPSRSPEGPASSPPLPPRSQPKATAKMSS